MSEKLMKKSRTKQFALLGVVAMAALTMWGCGTDGYSDPEAAGRAELAALVTTPNAPAIIDAPTLKSWIDQGKLNAAPGSLMSRDRVALVSVASMKNYTTQTKLHIPGAALFDSGTELYAVREEALGPVGSMVPSGAMMDSLVRKLGIDGNTTIVLTLPKGSTDSEHYAQSRAYFTFRYWGFDRNRVKILNGGDDAWDVSGYSALTKAAPAIAASSHSVSQNKAGLKDMLRASMCEMIQTVDTLIADPSQLNTWQMIDARGPSTTPYITNALRTQAPAGTAHAFMFVGDRVNADAARNRLYPSKTELVNRMALYPVKNGAEDAFVSPSKKTIVMCGSAISASPSFVLFDAVLGVPEGDISMYDGSSGQWNGYSTTRIAASSPTATAGQIEAWAFDNALNPRSQGTLPATGATLLSNYALYAPSNPLMNQIEEFDRAYMTPATAPVSGGSAGGSAGGGC